MGKKSKGTIPLSVLRQSRNMTQVDLSNTLNVSRSLIGLYETGKRKPSLATALKISDFFNVPVENISFSNNSVR